jgi:Plasmid pRiA4b ORF-3-like protein
MRSARSMEIYQFKVTLIGITPPIWRRFQAPGGFSLAQLHRAMQVVLGWENYHLYTFRIGSKSYGPPGIEDDDDFGLIDATRVRLSAVLRNVGTTITYVYDYGDDWEHALLLEAILMPDPEAIYPRCIAGERRCPPEDVGGIGGYIDYLGAMADPNHEQHEEMMMWRGPFDAEDFSIEQVNQELDKKFRSKTKPAARTAKGTSKPFVNRSRMVKTLTSVIPRVRQTPIKSGETVPLELNRLERDLIISHTFADESLTNRLRIAQQPGQRPVFHFTLDELDELVGDVAAEANHAKNRALQEQLDQLCHHIESVLSKYTDADV